MADAGKMATLTIGNKSLDLPLRSGTAGPDVVDISGLYNDAKVPCLRDTRHWTDGGGHAGPTEILAAW